MTNYGQRTQSDIKISLSIYQGELFGTQFHPLISGNIMLMFHEKKPMNLKFDFFSYFG